jgi:alkanesulfonate monooxygenase SsuD/methylene tetrahydromethanopterin reductase-like flavin-dependent oxidoreductase (luciferase family)
MLTDLVVSPFGASVPEIVAAAQAADTGGFDTVWTYDHFSGLVQSSAWVRDPFVTLAAVAASTERISVGPLVANAANRHPAQLACAVNSLQSLAPGRVLLGVGAGSGRRSAYASEYEAIGRPFADAGGRRAVLAETIEAVRALWRGDAFSGKHLSVAAAMAVTDGAALPPIIVGASHTDTVAVACAHADGVNLLPGDDLAERVALARDNGGDGFEISAFDALDVDHPLGGDPAPLVALGVDRRTLYIAVPYPVEAVLRIGAKLMEWNRANG